jgi:transcriptional regulator with XRE-family HTH domain
MPKIIRSTMAFSRHREDYVMLGVRLREARRTCGMTQKEAGDELEYPQYMISRIEAGKRRLDVFELAGFVRLYGTTFESLIRRV